MKKSMIIVALAVLLAVVPWAGAASGIDFVAAEDAQVVEISPDTNSGASPDLRVKAGGTGVEIDSYLKFTLSGVDTVANATLKLYSVDLNMGVDVYQAASNSWSESTISWNTAPGSTGASLDYAAVTPGAWFEFDVTSLVTGDGIYSFVLKGDVIANAQNFSSSEGAYPPVLTITEPGSDPNAPVISALKPADDTTNVVVGVDLAVTFDKNIVLGSGNITIKNLTDGTTETTIPVTDAAQISIVSTVLTINPTNDLAGTKEYAVLIDAGAIEDEAGNPFAGIPDNTTWNFTTTDPNGPNIIIIYSDDHGYTDLGLFGIDNNVDTPNMDTLASGGALMTNGYSSAPQCVPSRCGLMAGRIQNKFGLDENKADAGEGSNNMPRTYPAGSDMAGQPLLTIADRMKGLGYVTGFSGKWHCGPNNDSSQLHDPRSRGFDKYWVGPNGTYWANFDLAGNSIPHQHISDSRNRVIVQGLAAEAFIQRNQNNKFFLYLPLYAPHLPLIDTNDPYYTNFPVQDYPHYDPNDNDTRRKGLALIKAMDDSIGGVVQKLRDLGLEENTLILFAGDNGAMLGMQSDGTPEAAPVGNWNGSENVPMRGQKGQLMEGGIRVPMFAYWKGTIPSGQVIDEMVTTFDFTATTLAAGGGSLPLEFDGVDILPRLTGQESSITRTKPMFWDWRNQQAVRNGDWKLWRIADRDFLYNIANDPHELFDLALKEPAKAAELGADLDAWCTPLLDLVLPPGEVATAKNTLGPESSFGIHVSGNSVAAADPRYFTPYVDPVATPYPAPITIMGMDNGNFAPLSAAWLSDDTPTANWNEYYDLDDSGVIDINDLLIFADYWLMGN